MDLTNLLERFDKCPGASGAAISQCEAQIGLELQPDYIEFLETSNGGDGFIGEASHLIAFGAQELAEMNRVYEVETYAPGFLLFGSSGGGEGYFFDARTSPWTVVQIPFVGMSPELAEHLGASFSEFLGSLFNETDE